MVLSYWQATSVVVLAILGASTGFSNKFCGRLQLRDDLSKAREDDFRDFRAERRNEERIRFYEMRNEQDFERSADNGIDGRTRRFTIERKIQTPSVFARGTRFEMRRKSNLERMEDQRERGFIEDNYYRNRREDFRNIHELNRPSTRSLSSRLDSRLDELRSFLRESLDQEKITAQRNRHHNRVDMLNRAVLNHIDTPEVRNIGVFANERSRLEQRGINRLEQSRYIGTEDSRDISRYERSDRQEIYGSFNTRRERIASRNSRRDTQIRQLERRRQERSMQDRNPNERIHRILENVKEERQYRRERNFNDIRTRIPSFLANIRKVVENRNFYTIPRRHNRIRELVDQSEERRNLIRKQRDFEIELVPLNINRINHDTRENLDRQDRRMEGKRLFNQLYHKLSTENDIRESRESLHLQRVIRLERTNLLRPRNEEELQEYNRRFNRQYDDTRNGERLNRNYRQSERLFKFRDERADIRHHEEHQERSCDRSSYSANDLSFGQNIREEVRSKFRTATRFADDTRNNRRREDAFIQQRQNKERREFQDDRDRSIRKMIDSYRDRSARLQTTLNPKINVLNQRIRQISKANRREQRLIQNVRLLNNENVTKELSYPGSNTLAIQVLQAALIGFLVLRAVSRHDSLVKKLRFSSLANKMGQLASFGKVC